MALEVLADGRHHKCGHFGGRILLFDDHQSIERGKIRQELRTARAVLTPEEFVGTRGWNGFYKMSDTRECRVADAFVIERAVAQKCELGTVRNLRPKDEMLLT